MKLKGWKHLTEADVNGFLTHLVCWGTASFMDGIDWSTMPDLGKLCDKYSKGGDDELFEELYNEWFLAATTLIKMFDRMYKQPIAFMCHGCQIEMHGTAALIDVYLELHQNCSGLKVIDLSDEEI